MAKKAGKRGDKVSRIFPKSDIGLSPVITSILLIGIVIVIIAIIFLWFNGMVGEGVVKFGKNINLVCEDVRFKAGYSSGIISIVNNGNIPIFRLDIKTSGSGSYQTKDITTISGISWPSRGLKSGETFSGDIGSAVGSSSKITVLPVLIGTSSKGKKTFVCGGQYGEEIEI